MTDQGIETYLNWVERYRREPISQGDIGGRLSLTAQLKRAIERSGQSQFRLALMAGISPITLNRFLRGKRNLTLRTADKLCEVLNLRLR